MLQLKPFKQKSAFCGPACLKMVLRYYGLNKSEKELASLAGTTRARGTGARSLLMAAKQCGLKGFLKDFSEISDLKKYVINKKIPVIVDWFSGDEGHYSIVLGFRRDNILLMDPELGSIRTMKINKFKRVWFDFPGDFLKSKNEVIISRMLVVYR